MKKQQYTTPAISAIHISMQQMICTSSTSPSKGNPGEGVQPDKGSDGYYIAE